MNHLSVDSEEEKPFHSAILQSKEDVKLIKKEDNSDLYFIGKSKDKINSKGCS